MDRDRLAEQIVLHLAAGKADPTLAAAALRVVRPGDAARASVRDLLVLLEECQEPALIALRTGLRQHRTAQAARVHRLRTDGAPIPDDCRLDVADLPLDAPLGWQTCRDTLRAFRESVRVVRHWGFAHRARAQAPAAAAMLDQEMAGRATLLARAPALWSVARPEGIIERLLAAATCTAATQAALPRLRDWLVQGRAARTAAAARAVDAASGPAPDPADEEQALADLRARFGRATDRPSREALLRTACAWPTDLAAAALLEMTGEAWSQEYASLALTLRLPLPVGLAGTWREWRARLERAVHDADELREAVGGQPVESLLLWLFAHRAGFPAEIWTPLADELAGVGPAVDPEQFVCDWRGALLPVEADRILCGPRFRRATDDVQGPPPAAETLATAGRVPRLPATPPPLPAAAAPAAPTARAAPAAPAVLPVTAAAAPPVAEPPAAAEPSVWDRHVRPFLAENWYMVVGLAMVLVGSSILAYYTWDRSWLLRYTLVPGLLALFAAGLAETGGWLERRDVGLTATAAMLRGAAIALTPLNFMTVALVSTDRQVQRPELAVPLLAALYLALYGWGLPRWCRAVAPALGWLVGGPLLLLNAVTLLAPLATAALGLPAADGPALRVAGLYVGFVVVGATVVGFSRRVLNAATATDRRLSWFVGASLGVTLLEVFAWTHVWTRTVPALSTYAPMVVLTGGLVLLVERRILELRGETAYSSESFLGFALVFVGIILGLRDPYLRIVCFGLGGAVWLYQALPRQHPPDLWLSFTLLALAAAGIGLLPGFPGPWLPAIGIGLALLAGAVALLTGGAAGGVLRTVCLDFQLLLLVASVFVTLLTRWHLRPWPYGTALFLTALAGLFLWRGAHDDRSRWVHVGMLVLGLALPYVGCVDLDTQTPRGNTMASGLATLSVLWLFALHLRPLPALLRARSTVLLVYGVTAAAAVFLRVVAEGAGRVPTPGIGPWLDCAGPLVMALALGLAAWYSRSLLPMLVAAGIVVILVPELRDSILATWPWIHFGSGLGSAAAGVGLLLLCFPVRSSRRVQAAGTADPFLGGGPFPLCRTDHTLFTLPLQASAFFLLAKVDTWTVITHWQTATVPTAAALAVGGLGWWVAGVYHRSRAIAATMAYAGLLWILAGLLWGVRAVAPDADWQWPLISYGVLLHLLRLAGQAGARGGHPWLTDALAAPAEGILRRGSVVTALAALLWVVDGGDPLRVPWLLLLTAFELARQALRRQESAFGAVLFALGWVCLLAWTAPGAGDLVGRLSWEGSLLPNLWLIVGIHLAVLLPEAAPGLRSRLRPLVEPFLAAATLLVVALSVQVPFDAVTVRAIGLSHVWFLVVATLLTARAHGSGALLVPAAALAYLAANHGVLGGLPTPAERLLALLAPWKATGFSLALVVAAWAMRQIGRRYPWLGRGPFAWPWLVGGPVTWLYPVAAGLACAGVARHTFTNLRLQAAHLPAPYLAGATYAWIGWTTGSPAGFVVAAAAVTLGNVLLVWLNLRDYLLARGLSGLHVVCLGLAFSLAQASVLRAGLRSTAATTFLNRVCLTLAAAVLVIITANYIGDPNLGDITNLRLCVSGLLALAAGGYFRIAARRPGPGEEGLCDLNEAVFHYGLGLFGWCYALLIPWLRQPATTLLAFWLPGLYFHLRAEYLTMRGSPFARVSRQAAATVSFAVLGLYVFRAAFNLTFYPDQPIAFEHYHVNGPYIVLLGAAMLRLHAIGGTSWLALYGGLALMLGSYFSATWYPGCSPFTHPVPAAWVAVGLGHFWMAASQRRSPIRTAVRELAGVRPEEWLALVPVWGWAVTLGTLVAVLNAVLRPGTDPYAVAPLLAGAGSVLLHRALLARSTAGYAVAGLVLAVAVHTDFVVPSYLPREHVVRVVLAVWAATIGAQAWLRQRWEVGIPDAVVLTLAVLAGAQILYHGPDSPTGLWAAGLAALLLALTPRSERRPAGGWDSLWAALLLVTPTWLAFFACTAPRSQTGWPAPRATAALAATLTAYLTAVGADLFRLHGVAACQAVRRPQPRVVDHALALMDTHGERALAAALWVATLATVTVQALVHGRPCSVAELSLVCVLYAGLAGGWFTEGQRRQAAAPFVLLQVCVVLLFVALRRQLVLTTSFWQPEHDVWTALAASAVLAGLKPALDRQPAHVRGPVTVSLLLLPAFAIGWVLGHHLGTDAALLVIGLYSVLFAYQGKDDRESPYNALAVVGFVSFVALLFWVRLGWRVAYAYVVPAGLGVLFLLELYRQRLTRETRNGVRGATLAVMFASVGYSALLDDRYPIVFNLSLIGLGLATMGVGTLLRLRFFVAAGAVGVLTDLVSVLAKAVWHMERSAQMTVVGVLILVLGAALVGGTVYAKTHRAAVGALLDRFLARFGDWE